MSAPTPGAAPVHRSNGHHDLAMWRDHTRVFLQPIAAPSILGLFGFAAASFVVGAHVAGWYGTASSPELLFPFVAALGGLAQFAAAMWAYRARDGLATAVHGIWGSFWLAYGILHLLAAVDVLALPTGTFTELGFWFLALAAISASCAIAAIPDNLSLTAMLMLLASAAAVLAVGYLAGDARWLEGGGWLLVGSAVVAWYTATGMLLESSFGRVVLPIGKLYAFSNLSGRNAHEPIEFERGEPGVRHGQ